MLTTWKAWALGLIITASLFAAAPASAQSYDFDPFEKVSKEQMATLMDKALVALKADRGIDFTEEEGWKYFERKTSFDHLYTSSQKDPFWVAEMIYTNCGSDPKVGNSWKTGWYAGDFIHRHMVKGTCDLKLDH